MENCLEVRNLNKSYPNFELKDISFELPKGTIMGFIGENGAGKTTTIKSILNMISIQSGDITFMGENILDPAVKVTTLNDIGIVFDECCFHETLKVKDIRLIMKNIYSKWNDKTFKMYCDKFNIPKDKIVKEFSRGNKMKLDLAVALSHEPKLLILDEATSGLDPVIRNQMLDVFLDFIQNEDHSILLSSHITTDLEKVCDYITFIHDGKVIFTQNKDDILENYATVQCGAKERDSFDSPYILKTISNTFNTSMLINNKKEFIKQYPHANIEPITLDAIMLYYAGGEHND